MCRPQSGGELGLHLIVDLQPCGLEKSGAWSFFTWPLSRPSSDSPYYVHAAIRCFWTSLPFLKRNHTKWWSCSFPSVAPSHRLAINMARFFSVLWLLWLLCWSPVALGKVSISGSSNEIKLKINEPGPGRALNCFRQRKYISRQLGLKLKVSRGYTCFPFKRFPLIRRSAERSFSFSGSFPWFFSWLECFAFSDFL